MPREVLLPVVATDFECGTIEEWCKAVGDRVEAKSGVGVGDVVVVRGNERLRPGQSVRAKRVAGGRPQG